MKNLSFLFSYLKPYRKQMVLTLFAAAIGSSGLVAATYLIGKAIDLVPEVSSVQFAPLFLILGLLGGIYLLSSLFQWVIARLANKISYSVACDLRKEAFEKLQKLPVLFFDAHPHGDLLSRFTNDIDAVSDALSVTIINLFSGLILILVSIAVMFSLNVPLALTVLLVTPICVLFATVITRLCQKSFRRQQTMVGSTSSFAAEHIENQKLIKLFGQEQRTIDEFSKMTDKLEKTATRAIFFSAVINPGTRFVNNTCYILVGLVGALSAIHFGLSVGTISSFLIYSGQFAKPFNEISGITVQIQTAFAALERISSLINAAEETDDPKEPISLQPQQVKGHVVFSNVSFSYTKGRPILKDISLEAHPGEMIAIVGATGCGKTTLINLLLRFYEIDKGNILIDDSPIQQLKRNDLRNAFALVLQDTWLFHGTIAQNIAFVNENASQEQIVAAAKQAYAHSFITRLPHGYDTVYQPNMLSQGEQQLLTIARAILSESKMMILDEATSSIDSLTEQRIQQALQHLTANKTSFIIAHRLSTIQAADRILVLERGKVVEEGTHTQLLQLNGIYAEMYRKNQTNQ